MLGGSNVEYARLTRRWWAPVQAHLAHEGLADRPLYFVSSNNHSLVNIATGVARERENELVRFVETLPAGRHPAGGAGRVPRRPLRGVVGELPLLRGPPVVGLARTGRAGRAPRRRAGSRRHAPGEHDGAAGARAGDPARGARSRIGSTRGSGRIDVERARRERCGDRQHRLPARRRARTTSCARSRSTAARACAASTSSARRRRSTPTSAT